MKRSLSVDSVVDNLLKKQKLAEEMWPDEMTPEAAKRIERLQEKWLEDSKRNQRLEAERVRELFSVHPTLVNVKPENQLLIPPPKRENKPITVEEAKRIDKLQDELKAGFEKSRARESDEKREIERQHEPVVNELRKLREELRKKDDELKELRAKQMSKPLLFRPRVMSTPSRREFDKSIAPANIQEQDVFDKDTVVPQRDVPQQKDNIFEAETIMQAAGTPLPESDDDDMRVDKSIQAIVERSGPEVGALARQYLSNANDGTFGFNYDIGERKLKVGNSGVTIVNDDIIVDKTNERFTGTPGLWRLLTQSRDIGSEQYSKSDREAYKKILIDSGAIYQSNDPSSGRPKSSQGHKWKKVIKPMWEELRAENLRGNLVGTGLKNTNQLKLVRAMGTGLLVDTNNPIEYKYIRQYADLVKRLYFLNAEESAGNNSFHNEKLGIVKFIYDRLMELTEKPKGHKYITRCMLVLPKEITKLLIDELELSEKDNYKKDVVKFIHSALEKLIDLPDGPMYLARCLSSLPEKIIMGSGILNDIINKLPFELHAPGMNFLGPGTKLKERLARGDEGVNPLDEAAKEHDIWYSKHKRAEDRWQADKVLEDKAFERVIAPDASIYERPLALATGTAMWAKQKLGMGLEPAALLNKDDENISSDKEIGKIQRLKLGLASDRKKYMLMGKELGRI